MRNLLRAEEAAADNLLFQKLMELGMGIESPTAGRQNDLASKWRCCRRFFAASSPFFFFRGLRSSASLVGDEKNGSKDSQLPSLRQNTVRGLSKRYSQKESQMPKVRQREKLESWKIKSGYSAVLLQKLRKSICRALNNPFSFFFSMEASD